MTTRSDLLRVENLAVAFELHGQPHHVLHGVSLRVKPGSVVAIVGESGSGKSVTAQAILGILPQAARITGGRILFADPTHSGPPADIAALPRDSAEMRALRGKRISMIFQEPMTSLSPLHTIGDQVEEALVTHLAEGEQLSRRDARGRTEEMLALVGFPDPARAYDMYAFELSGGLRQRAMIAMALICRPALLVADEPTTALDVTIQAQVLRLLKDLQQKLGMAMLLITHDLGVVANMADEVVVMYGGEVMEYGPSSAIFRTPRHTYLKALFQAVPHFDMEDGERLVSLRDSASGKPPRSPGANGAALHPSIATADRDAPPILSVHDVRKSFTIRKGSWFSGGPEEAAVAVAGVSLDIARGECLGLVGESGCGKTTLSKILMRALTPDSGRLVFRPRADETSNGGGTTAEIDMLALEGEALMRFRRRMQMVFQDPVGSLSPRMTVLNILREPLQVHGLGTAAWQRERVTELMRSVGLDPRFLNRYPHSFSGGQRQRIGIARALALEPELVICDEPVSALDVSVQAQILNLLKDLKAELGLTYIFISHNLAVVDYMADRIAVMARGRLVEIAPRHVLFRRPAHPYTRALLKAVPYPDLDRPLEFVPKSLAGASDESGWPPAFRSGETTALAPLDLGEGHVVLANPHANLRELTA